jgi:hypothetical protein
MNWRSVARTCAEPNGILDQPAFDFSMKSRHALVVERHLATHEYIEHDSKAPDVDFRASVDFGVEEFGGSKVQRAAKGG